MRTSSAILAALTLAACGGGGGDESGPAEDRAAPQAVATAVSEPRVPCAIGDAAFANVCTIERVETADGALITLRHPDGGFRRLRVSRDGDIAAADGAIPAAVGGAADDGTVEVAIGDARYRLPSAR